MKLNDLLKKDIITLLDFEQYVATLEFKQVTVPIDYDDNLYPVIGLKCLAIDK